MTRRMTLIVLALVGVMVLVVTVSPPQPGVRGGAESTPTPSPAPTGLTDRDTFDVTGTLSAEPGAQAKTIEAEVGDRVEILVEGPNPDTVLLGELESKSVDAGIPARFELLADTPGSYPLVLTNENRRVGTLEIR